MASIARKNLLEDIPRFLVAQAGIMFAVTLITIQTGILEGFTRSTALVVDNSKADILVSSNQVVNFELTLPIPAALLEEAQAVPGVEIAEPLLLGSARWTKPGTADIVPMRPIGFYPDGQLFRLWNLTAGDIDRLKEPYTAIVDESSLDTLNAEGVGDTGQMNSLPATIVGLTQGTQSTASSTFAFMSIESAKAYATVGLTSSVRCRSNPDGELDCSTVYRTEDSETGVPPVEPLAIGDAITHILIKAEPGQDIEALTQRLETVLPEVRVMTREEMAEMTRSYWKSRTGVGFILGLGAGLGVIVGVAIVGQILYSSVSDRLKEYGTLKAMGASDWTLYRIVIEQALWMSVLGYMPGMALCLGVSVWAEASMGVTILITPVTAIGVLGITVAMCVGSAFFAIAKVTRVDPAAVFRS